MVNLTGVNTKIITIVAYPNLLSAIRPISRLKDFPVPVFQTLTNEKINENTSVLPMSKALMAIISFS